MTHASIPTVATPPARSRLSMPFRLLARPWLLLRSRDVLAQGMNRLLSRGSVDPRHTHGGRELRACHAWLAMCGEQDSAANVSLAIGRNSIGADLLMARAMPVCAPGGANELVSYGKIGSWVENGFYFDPPFYPSFRANLSLISFATYSVSGHRVRERIGGNVVLWQGR